MKSLWLRKLTIVVVSTLTTISSMAWGQCPDGCGAPLMGSVPGSLLGDNFSAGDSFSGGPCGPTQGPAGWGGGGGTGYELGGACCGPHWYDFMIQGVFLKRDGGDSQGLMSLGIRGNAPANIVQSIDDTDFNFEAGIRVGGRFQTSALHSIEAIYMGGLDWDDQHTVTNENHNLYSVFSDFGNDPFGGFDDSDQASISTITYDSELDSAEINFRRALTPRSERMHGSLLWGFRYLRVDEGLTHHIDVLPHIDDVNGGIARTQESTDYSISVSNDLFGIQAGGESVFCIAPGIQLGAEGKLGVFGTNVDLSSNLNSTALANATAQADSKGAVSFMSDANMFFLWQFHPMFKFRAGYEVLFINGIGTAGSNYDSAARSASTGNPLLVAQRVADADTDDSVFYHGAHFGFEFGW